MSSRWHESYIIIKLYSVVPRCKLEFLKVTCSKIWRSRPFIVTFRNVMWLKAFKHISFCVIKRNNSLQGSGNSLGLNGTQNHPIELSDADVPLFLGAIDNSLSEYTKFPSIHTVQLALSILQCQPSNTKVLLDGVMARLSQARRCNGFQKSSLGTVKEDLLLRPSFGIPYYRCIVPSAGSE